MTNKIKVIIVLTAFLFVLFSILNAESNAGLRGETEIEDVTKKVYPSVVKVEVRNRIRKVATGVVIDKIGHIVRLPSFIHVMKKSQLSLLKEKRWRPNFWAWIQKLTLHSFRLRIKI